MPIKTKENSSNSIKYRKQALRMVCLTALFSALITLSIAYLPKIPLANGYVHIGDSFVYLAASVLPFPYSCLACALGGGLADILCGYAVYAPASFLIKGVTALCFGSVFKKHRKSEGAANTNKHKTNTIINKRNFIALLPCAIICFGGYFSFEAFLYGVAAASLGIPMNILQSVVGSVIYIAIGITFDKVHLLQRLDNLNQ